MGLFDIFQPKKRRLAVDQKLSEQSIRNQINISRLTDRGFLEALASNHADANVRSAARKRLKELN